MQVFPCEFWKPLGTRFYRTPIVVALAFSESTLENIETNENLGTKWVK